jgi:hypothetical protein
MVKKAPRGVRPIEVRAALQRLFEKFLFEVEKERLRRGIEGQLSAAQIVFWPGLETSVRLNDEVALQLSFADAGVTELLRADLLDYARAPGGLIDGVAADEGSLGHITALVGRRLEVHLESQPSFVLPKLPWARGIAAWDLRKVLAEAIATKVGVRTALLDVDEDNRSERWWRRKQIGRGVIAPDSGIGRQLFELLRPKSRVSHLFKWLGVDREEWLTSALAEIILEGSFEDTAVALLPAQYLFVEGQDIVLWQGWLGDGRAAAEVIPEMARAKAEAEAYGKGLGSRRSKSQVITESDLPHPLDDLEYPAGESLEDGVVKRRSFEEAVKQLTPSEKRAFIVYQDVIRDDISVEEACRRHKWKPVPIRKGWERARKHLQQILGDSDSP